tara:strand:+ start:3310 stop:5772 length:2463 start_codon:yes stop_codon:yes gene_type:complete
MPIHVIQPSFSGGELAPSLHARVDLAKYATGLKTCRNFLVQAHGGVANRTGTKFITETKNSAKKTRLIPFEFNTTQTYVLELGHLTMRVIKDGGLISLAANPPAYAGSRSYDITETDSSDVNYPFVRHSNVNYILISGTGLNVTPGTNAAVWHALTGLVIEIPTPYTETEIAEIDFTQSADIMTIVHTSHPVQELKRYSHYAWDLVPVVFGTTMAAPTNVASTRQEYDSSATETSYSYVVTSVKTDTGEESIASSATSISNNNLSNTVTNTITWTAVSGADSYNVYKSRGGIYGFVGRATSTTFKDDNIEADANDSPASARTIFNTTNEFPGTVVYYQQRLVFGQTNNDPQKIFMSQTGNFHNFNISEPLRDDDAVTFTIAASQVNEIRHLVPLSDLIILTSGGEWLMTANDGVVSPSTIQVKPQGYRGSADAPPIVIGNTIIHLQAKGAIIRDLAFALESDSYTGNDLTVLASHLFAGKTVKEWAYAQAPHSIVWVVLNDGTLAALTYMREHEVWGWSRHDTDGTFESVCTISEGDEDATYFVVNRTIGGATKRYIERYHTRVFDTVADAFFVDSGLSYDGTNTSATTLTLSGGSNWTHSETLTLTANASTFVSGDPGNTFTLTIGTETLVCTVQAYTSATVVTVKAGRDVPVAFRSVATAVWSKGVDAISGMGHLEGKTISILADGNVEAQKVVSSGAITISHPASKIHLGLPIQGDVQTLNLELGQPTQQGKKKSISAVTLRVEESRGGKIGFDKDHLTEFKQRAYEPYGTATSLKTGDIKVTMPSTWASEGTIFYRQDDPLPMTLLAVIPEVSVGG